MMIRVVHDGFSVSLKFIKVARKLTAILIRDFVKKELNMLILSR